MPSEVPPEEISGVEAVIFGESKQVLGCHVERSEEMNTFWVSAAGRVYPNWIFFQAQIAAIVDVKVG